MKNTNLLGADFTNAKLNNINWGKDNKVLNEFEAEEHLLNGNIEKSKETNSMIYKSNNSNTYKDK